MREKHRGSFGWRDTQAADQSLGRDGFAKDGIVVREAEPYPRQRHLNLAWQIPIRGLKATWNLHLRRTTITPTQTASCHTRISSIRWFRQTVDEACPGALLIGQCKRCSRLRGS